MESIAKIEILIDGFGNNLSLIIEPKKEGTLFDAGTTAADNNEARYQLVEGFFYDYELTDPGLILDDIGENIVQPHRRKPHLGTLAPNIFVGTLTLPVLDAKSGKLRGEINLEVQSVKSDYRSDYRDMLELITEKCTDLLLRASSPVSQYFEADYSADSRTLYQRFSFIRSILGSDEFSEAVHRVVTTPVTRWADIPERRDVRNAGRFTGSVIRELLKGGKRTALPDGHSLAQYGLATLPEKITTIRKTDSVDTPENRFIKHALENFLKFCTDLNQKAKEGGYKKLIQESEDLVRKLEEYLHHSFFNELSRPDTLKLNSPVLQRKEGYREILRVWLMFDLAAKLIWKGGDDVYSGGKKDVAVLYEYWLFFKLLDLFQSVFEIESVDINNLIQEAENGLSLQIKQGTHTALRGVYDSGNRVLNIRFNYNRPFGGAKKYPAPGSWTTTLRPDYTLSVWPDGISENEAEKEELIVHIHFDAKYKVANLTEILSNQREEDLDIEEIENRKGIYKNADLLKMHAYRDAIRRTGGAYVLYPGEKAVNHVGFHEIIPGLGAFPVRPSKTDDGTGELKVFILEVLNHFVNRTSQREKIAYRTFDIYKNEPEDDNRVKAPLPEAYGENRGLLPDETFVLIGFYNSPEQRTWIEERKLYNFRMGTERGSLILDKDMVSAKYLLLHTHGEKSSGDIWKIKSEGPKVFSKQDMLAKGYPSPSRENYLVVEIEPVTEKELMNIYWDFRKLQNYETGRKSAIPFTASLAELMQCKTATHY